MAKDFSPFMRSRAQAAPEPKPPMKSAGPSRPAARADGKLTAGVPLGAIIRRTLEHRGDLPMMGTQRSVIAEQFRRLKTLILNEQVGNPQVLIVTSAVPGDGKSMIAMNLALALAAEGEGDVLAVDADLRRPTLGTWLRPAPRIGLTEILTGQTDLDQSVLDLEGTALRVLPAGEASPDPVALFGSNNLERLFKVLRERYWKVVIDSPPIIPFTDADAIARHCDGVLLVARSGKTTSEMIRRAVESITTSRVIGTVLNDHQFNLADSGYYHYEKYYKKYYGENGS